MPAETSSTVIVSVFLNQSSHSAANCPRGTIQKWTCNVPDRLNLKTAFTEEGEGETNKRLLMQPVEPMHLLMRSSKFGISQQEHHASEWPLAVYWLPFCLTINFQPQRSAAQHSPAQYSATMNQPECHGAAQGTGDQKQ